MRGPLLAGFGRTPSDVAGPVIFPKPAYGSCGAVWNGIASHLCLFRHLQGIIDLDTQAPNGALHLRVAQQPARKQVV